MKVVPVTDAVVTLSLKLTQKLGSTTAVESGDKVS